MNYFVFTEFGKFWGKCCDLTARTLLFLTDHFKNFIYSSWAFNIFSISIFSKALSLLLKLAEHPISSMEVLTFVQQSLSITPNMLTYCPFKKKIIIIRRAV